MKNGKIHLYYGEGKGKTTAAAGLCTRALGCGKIVLVVRFLKNRSSGEIVSLKKLGAKVISCKIGENFAQNMTADERKQNRINNDNALKTAVMTRCDILLLDELCAALEYDLVDQELAKVAIAEKSDAEIIITGREPRDWMFEVADYITEMKCVRHPADRGLEAREGIEF